jgi:hypothetical protein
MGGAEKAWKRHVINIVVVVVWRPTPSLTLTAIHNDIHSPSPHRRARSFPAMTSTEESWILRLAVALAAATPGAAVSALFAPAGVLRDSLVFSWDVRALEGAAAISEYVARGVEARGCVREVRLESVDGGRLFFAFRTPLGRGRGGAQLDAHGRAEWATFMLDVLDGNDEAVPVDSAAYRRASETAPYVVVGAFSQRYVGNVS